MQFNIGSNNVSSSGYIKQKDSVFVHMENHADSVLQSDTDKAESANKPCSHLASDTVP